MNASIAEKGRALIGRLGTRLAKQRQKSRDTAPDYPWFAAYPPGLDWSERIEEQALHTVMDVAAQRFAENPCIDFLGKTYTYREIGEQVNRAAKGFQHLGVVKGMKVGLCLPNTPYAVVCYYAILKAGGTVVNYNPLYVERELAHQVEDSDTDIMVTLDLEQIYPKVAALLESTRLRYIVVCRMSDILPPLKGMLFSALKASEVADIPEDIQHIPFANLVNNDGVMTPPEIDAVRDVAVLQYTGGTTGLPKGAMLTHGNLSANLTQVRRWVGGFQEGEECILGVLPLFHVFGMTLVMNLGIFSGAELVLLLRFELDDLLKAIDRSRATVLMGVPTIYTAIVSAPKLSNYDLTSIKYCISGGAPLPMALKQSFEAVTGCVLVEGYGLSECAPVATCNPIAGVNKEGSVGIPLPGTVVEIRNVEAPEQHMPLGEIGEICISGPQVMTGYWQRPDETAMSIVDGWLHTGDVGYMDGDGYVFLVDRIKNLIICGGFNVYPRVIEEAILLHPAVVESTVIGVPDEYRGETPKAFVKLGDGQSLDEAELKAFLKDSLSPIEMPAAIEFRDELPKTLIGKPSKKELAAEEAAKYEPAK